MRKINIRLVPTKPIFTISIIVGVLTVLGVWLFGLGQHRTIFENSVLSTTILSWAFFLFLSIGLYRGIKLKDNIGKITKKITINDIPDVSLGDLPDVPDVGEGISGIILSVILWILISILFIVAVWIFGALLWMMVLAFIAMMYWIFFRALRLVFKKSEECKDDLFKSIAYALGYTLLYNCWIYLIIFIAHYLVK